MDRIDWNIFFLYGILSIYYLIFLNLISVDLKRCLNVCGWLLKFKIIMLIAFEVDRYILNARDRMLYVCNKNKFRGIRANMNTGFGIFVFF